MRLLGFDGIVRTLTTEITKFTEKKTYKVSVNFARPDAAGRAGVESVAKWDFFPNTKIRLRS